MPARSQRKGRGGELELTRLLNEYGIPAEVGTAVSFGSSPDITGIRGIHAEVKRTERFRCYEALEQAENDARKFADGLPAVFHRQNRHGWIVVMKLEDWLQIYGRTTFD